MLRKPGEPGKRSAPAWEHGNGGRLLEEIEAIGRALHLTKNRRRSVSAGKSRLSNPRRRSGVTDSRPPPPPTSERRKKMSPSSSIWNWKPLRALSHIRHRRLNCLFTMRVHSIEGLPPSFHSTAICVHWERRGGNGLRTRAVRVFHGAAEFEETLAHPCVVYGSRDGRQAKYEARKFVLYPAVEGAPRTDLGEHRVDLTRMLPLTPEELERETSGRWSTTFKLSGAARGASLGVSFGFSLSQGQDMVESEEQRCEAPPPPPSTADDHRVGLRRMGSVSGPNNGESSGRFLLRSRSMEDIKIIHEAPPASPAEQQQVDVRDLSADADRHKHTQDNLKISPPFTPHQDKPPPADAGFDHDPEFTVVDQGIEMVANKGMNGRDIGGVGKMNKPPSFDDMAELVADEFLSKIGAEHGTSGPSSESDAESPRDCIWKQFERELLARREGIFADDLDGGEGPDFDLPSAARSAETGQREISLVVSSRTRARMLEDAGMEALLQEWGLSGTAFRGSPPGSAGGFGSPIELLPDESPGVSSSSSSGPGPSFPTKGGGFLHEMRLFKSPGSNGSLIMKVSCPTVVPAEMRSSAMEILDNLASMGATSDLSAQPRKPMPLEDINGDIEQLASWGEEEEELPALEACERRFFQHLDPVTYVAKRGTWRGAAGPSSSDCVSLEDLVPPVMENIENLAVEGLRVRSGISGEDAPSSCIGPLGDPFYVREIPKSSNFDEDADGFLDDLFITLDERTKLECSGGLPAEDRRNDDGISGILAAHRADSEEPVAGEGEDGGNSGRKLTIALNLLLRHPSRDCEPVGSPTLALIQAERVPPFPEPGRRVTSPEEEEIAGEGWDTPGF